MMSIRHPAQSHRENLVFILIETHCLARIIESVETEGERLGDIIRGKNAINQCETDRALAIRTTGVTRIMSKIIGRSQLQKSTPGTRSSRKDTPQ